MTVKAKLNMSTNDEEALYRIFQKRRSVRAYLHDKPNRDDIVEILGTARFAPNSCNLQHYGFIYIDDDKTLKALEPVATRKVSWAPALIVIIDDFRFSQTRSAGLQSVAAATENILLSAAAKGLGTCWMAGFKGDEGIRNILGIPSHFEVTGLMGIGYPDPATPAAPTQRLNPEDFIHFNKFENKGSEFITEINVDNWPMDKLVSYKERIGSVYAPRKGIQLYHRNMISESAKLYIDLQNERQKVTSQEKYSAIDIASYDGCFMRDLYKNRERLEEETDLYTSDYSSYFLDLIKNQCPNVQTVPMALNHTLDFSGTQAFDFISCAFKIDFLPETEKLLSVLKQYLSNDGRLFLTSVPLGSPRSLLYKFDTLINRPNMYDGNRLYRHGPYRHLSSLSIEKSIKSAGWSIEKKGNAGTWPKTDFKWWWLSITD